MNRLFLQLLLLASPLLWAGCGSPDVYHWGHYEDLIYVTYAKPGKLPPDQQVQIMLQDQQKAQAASKPVPPGWHAQLGYLYYQTGKPQLARQEFENEKKQFPESAQFIDHLLLGLPKP